LQPADADSICARFIFLDLLVRQPDRFAEGDPADLRSVRAMRMRSPT